MSRFNMQSTCDYIYNTYIQKYIYIYLFMYIFLDTNKANTGVYIHV